LVNVGDSFNRQRFAVGAGLIQNSSMKPMTGYKVVVLV
jgi:hypothetical protein